MEALTGLGLRPRVPVEATDFADEGLRRDWVENRNMQVFSFYDPSNPLREIDVFVEYPVDIEELVRDAATVEFDGQRVRIASVGHLIQMKLAAGRPQDVEDVQVLRELEAQRGRD